MVSADGEEARQTYDYNRLTHDLPPALSFHGFVLCGFTLGVAGFVVCDFTLGVAGVLLLDCTKDLV
jgi:hypothetical protein